MHQALGADPFCGLPSQAHTTAPDDPPPQVRVRRAHTALAALLSLVLIVVLVVAVNAFRQRDVGAQYPVTAAALERARAELGQLERPDAASVGRYDRRAFGQAWADVDRNGCDTRNDILARDLTSLTYQSSSPRCVILTGTLADPYTGRTLTFERGPRSGEVQIDHVVALANAWAHGAAQWDAGMRREFANDPRNLLAVDGPANQAKGAADAADWLPENRGFRCVYVMRQVEVKAAYRLTVTAAEAAAMGRALNACVVAVAE